MYLHTFPKTSANIASYPARLSYYSKNVEDAALPAQLPRATEYIGGNPFVPLNTEMKAAIIAGFSAAPNFDVPNYYCASGNCTWVGGIISNEWSTTSANYSHYFDRKELLRSEFAPVVRM